MAKRYVFIHLLIVLAVILCVTQVTVVFIQNPSYLRDSAYIYEEDIRHREARDVVPVNCSNDNIITQQNNSQNNSPPEEKRYLTTRLYGLEAHAGLGNVLFELISLIGIADQLDRIPYVNVGNPVLMAELHRAIYHRYPQLLSRLVLRFGEEDATVLFFNGFKCCEYDEVSRIKGSLATSLTLNGVWFQSFKYFHHMRNTVRELITPPPPIEFSVNTVLPSPVYKHNIVCIHVRRGDFVADGYHKPTDEDFTIEAIKFLNKRYNSQNGNSSVVIMGNDAEWEKIMTMGFSNVHVLENTTPEQDLSFSQQFCDAVLITAPSSTFGFWLAYLAKEGATIFYRDIVEVGEQVLREFNPPDFFPPNWIRLNMLAGTILTSE